MDDTPFDVVMQQAAKLKTEQLAVYRRKYDTFPLWYQHSLFSVDYIIRARDTFEFEELHRFGLELKKSGNEDYEAENIHGAINYYEKVLSLFKWLKPTREDWKKRVCLRLFCCWLPVVHVCDRNISLMTSCASIWVIRGWMILKWRNVSIRRKMLMK